MPALALFLLLILLPGSSFAAEDLLDPGYWRRQAVERLGPNWLRHAPDPKLGAFYTELARDWTPGNSQKMPPMIARQIFGFCAVYLLSGDERYLEEARRGARYLLDHGWDRKHGGWYNRLTPGGAPLDERKTVSYQLYTNVGLTMYSFVTGDGEAIARVHRSLDIRRTRAHDTLFGGYVQELAPGLPVADWGKNKHAHYGYVGSLLLNLYLATGDAAVLGYSRELMDLSLGRMRDETGFFYGFHSKFNRRWERAPFLAGGVDAASIGAQLTAALALFRLHQQTGDGRYLAAGRHTGELVTRHGWNSESGAWVDHVAAAPPHRPVASPTVHWWIQIYGSLLQLHLYRATGESRYLDNFQRSATFFEENFHDPVHGGIFPAVGADGAPRGKQRKAGPWQTSYHELEHALLNYLYLSLYVHGEPATLYFHLAGEGPHRVSPVDDPAVRIRNVEAEGRPHGAFDPRERTITLTGGAATKLRVVLETK